MTDVPLARERKQIRFDSVADSIVWMKEEADTLVSRIRFVCPAVFIAGFFIFILRFGHRKDGSSFLAFFSPPRRILHGGYHMKKRIDVRDLVKIALLGAVAFILLSLRFPLPFMPPFMDFDFSGIPEMVGLFTMGPAAGIYIVLIKVITKTLMTGTSSAFTGELQNIIVSCAYILPVWFFYRKEKSKRAALKGMIAGTVVCAIVAVFSNMFIIIPFYAKAYNFSMERIIEMVHAVNRFVDSEWKFIAMGIVPFNLIKGGVTTAVIYSIYTLLMRIAKKEEHHVIQ